MIFSMMLLAYCVKKLLIFGVNYRSPYTLQYSSTLKNITDLRKGKKKETTLNNNYCNSCVDYLFYITFKACLTSHI